ncbi:hypothetical protein GTY86_33695 [Streptomyces sp. SID5770]|uniref:hypothetical protein n=1 Tax=Streptomyces sp. SID5770 TaxID=2690308 RepID=UPI0013713546|nr:hypothetical protein [Streptomyces sp. SID5770]MZE56139.1 hypothetical protein [Streptomyces sp. SID5770]
MTDYDHAIQQQHALQHALENHFGQPAQWPLEVQAAYAQLHTMRRLMGDDYPHFIQLARQAIHQHRDKSPISTLHFRADHLKLLLQLNGHYGPSDTLHLGWTLNASLEALLDNTQYERLIDAAAEAADLEPAT